MPDETQRSPSPTRRRLRFSLASLLWAVVVVSLLLDGERDGGEAPSLAAGG